MSLTFFLALRHLGNLGRSRAVTLTGLVAAGGIFVGVLAITVILAVMNGMEQELAVLIHDGEAHVELTPPGPAGIPDAEPLLAAAAAVPGVAGAAPYARSELLAVHRGPDGRTHMETALLTGVAAARESTVTRVLANTVPAFAGFAPNPDWILEPSAEIEDGAPGLLVGVELAADLRVGVGQAVRLVVPDASSARAGNLDSLRGREAIRRVVGLVDAGLYEFNATRIFGELGETADFLRVDGEAQGVAVRCGDPDRAPAVAARLLALPEFAGFAAETWQDRNRVLFAAMAREKTLMYLFLLLTAGVASLGIVGALTLMISIRRGEIGILRTLGMSRRRIMGMVVLEGWIVGIVGTALGLAGGWGLAALLARYPLRIPWDLFILETVPILLNPIDFVWVACLTLGVSLLATIYPGWEAARLDPIEAIRGV